MWFKQITLLKLSTAIQLNPEEIEPQLDPFISTPCPPSFAYQYGWTPPIDQEGAPLIHVANRRYLLFCMQLEEKILPATVVHHEVNVRVKQLEREQARKISHREKLSLKEEITHTLLSRAFSKLSRIYAYIDNQHHWLIINTVTTAKIEKVITLLKKSLPGLDIRPFSIVSMAPVLTQWLLQQQMPVGLTINQSCVLSDPTHKTRVIRCQQQDLSVNAIHALIKDGCQVNQLALNWQSQLDFQLADDFTLRQLQYSDEITESAKLDHQDSPQHAFDVNFILMTETLTPLLTALVQQFKKQPATEKTAAQSVLA